MELRRIPARRAGLTAMVALLVAGASACSGGTGVVGTPPAATVNGTQISQADVMATTEATQRFYEDGIERGQDTDGSLAALVQQMEADSPHAVGTEGAARVLSDMIADQVIHDELEAHDALPTKADRADLRSQIEQSVGADELKKIDAEYLDLYIEGQVLNNAFTAWAAAQANKEQKPYTEAEREEQKQSYYEQGIADRPLCLNAIQTTTEAEATAAKKRVDAGEDFVAVSRELAPAGSTIPTTGAIACLTLEQAQQAFGQDFSGAKVGDVVGPVAYDTGSGSQPVYLVLRVDQTDGMTREEADPMLEEIVPTEPAAVDETTFDASGALDELLKAASIEVNPLFGRWSDASQAVVPPRVPGATTTTATSTTTAAASTTAPATPAGS